MKASVVLVRGRMPPKLAGGVTVFFAEAMDFILLSLGLVGFIVLVLVLIARAYPGSGADLVDWRPTRSYEDEARLESEDIQQMIAAQNEMRRRRGKPDLTAADASRMAREDEAVRERQRRSYDERLDELEDELGV
jgi:hypothetical protein